MTNIQVAALLQAGVSLFLIGLCIYYRTKLYWALGCVKAMWYLLKDLTGKDKEELLDMIVQSAEFYGLEECEVGDFLYEDDYEDY